MDYQIHIGKKGKYTMTITEIIEAMKEFENTPEFDTYINSHITAERVNKYLESDDGKKILQPKLDTHFNKGLKTWQDNNLAGLVDAEIKKRYPEKDEKDIELANVKAELEKMKAEATRKDLTNKALQIATEKKLPVDLIDYFIGADEKTTTANLGKLEKAFTTAIGAAVDEKLKGGYVPPEGEPVKVDGVTAAFMALNPGLKLSGE